MPQCEFLFACNGDCPKHRFLRAPDGEPGLSYLCAAYRRFFRHIDPGMRIMRDLLDSRRAPAEIMRILRERERPVSASPIDTGIPKTAPCPCGSGRKFKRCYGATP